MFSKAQYLASVVGYGQIHLSEPMPSSGTKKNCDCEGAVKYYSTLSNSQFWKTGDVSCPNVFKNTNFPISRLFRYNNSCTYEKKKNRQISILLVKYEVKLLLIARPI